MLCLAVSTSPVELLTTKASKYGRRRRTTTVQDITRRCEDTAQSIVLHCRLLPLSNFEQLKNAIPSRLSTVSCCMCPMTNDTRSGVHTTHHILYRVQYTHYSSLLLDFWNSTVASLRRRRDDDDDGGASLASTVLYCILSFLQKEKLLHCTVRISYSTVLYCTLIFLL